MLSTNLFQQTTRKNHFFIVKLTFWISIFLHFRSTNLPTINHGLHINAITFYIENSSSCPNRNKLDPIHICILYIDPPYQNRVGSDLLQYGLIGSYFNNTLLLNTVIKNSYNHDHKFLLRKLKTLQTICIPLFDDWKWWLALVCNIWILMGYDDFLLFMNRNKTFFTISNELCNIFITIIFSKDPFYILK